MDKESKLPLHLRSQSNQEMIRRAAEAGHDWMLLNTASLDQNMGLTLTEQIHREDSARQQATFHRNSYLKQDQAYVLSALEYRARESDPDLIANRSLMSKELNRQRQQCQDRAEKMGQLRPSTTPSIESNESVSAGPGQVRPQSRSLSRNTSTDVTTTRSTRMDALQGSRYRMSAGVPEPVEGSYRPERHRHVSRSSLAGSEFHHVQQANRAEDQFSRPPSSLRHKSSLQIELAREPDDVPLSQLSGGSRRGVAGTFYTSEIDRQLRKQSSRGHLSSHLDQDSPLPDQQKSYNRGHSLQKRNSVDLVQAGDCYGKRYQEQKEHLHRESTMRPEIVQIHQQLQESRPLRYRPVQDSGLRVSCAGSISKGLNTDAATTYSSPSPSWNRPWHQGFQRASRMSMVSNDNAIAHAPVSSHVTISQADRPWQPSSELHGGLLTFMPCHAKSETRNSDAPPTQTAVEKSRIRWADAASRFKDSPNLSEPRAYSEPLGFGKQHVPNLDPSRNRTEERKKVLSSQPFQDHKEDDDFNGRQGLRRTKAFGSLSKSRRHSTVPTPNWDVNGLRAQNEGIARTDGHFLEGSQMQMGPNPTSGVSSLDQEPQISGTLIQAYAGSTPLHFNASPNDGRAMKEQTYPVPMSRADRMTMDTDEDAQAQDARRCTRDIPSSASRCGSIAESNVPSTHRSRRKRNFTSTQTAFRHTWAQAKDKLRRKPVSFAAKSSLELNQPSTPPQSSLYGRSLEHENDSLAAIAKGLCPTSDRGSDWNMPRPTESDFSSAPITADASSLEQEHPSPSKPHDVNAMRRLEERASKSSGGPSLVNNAHGLGDSADMGKPVAYELEASEIPATQPQGPELASLNLDQWLDRTYKFPYHGTEDPELRDGLVGTHEDQAMVSCGDLSLQLEITHILKSRYNANHGRSASQSSRDRQEGIVWPEIEIAPLRILAQSRETRKERRLAKTIETDDVSVDEADHSRVIASTISGSGLEGDVDDSIDDSVGPTARPQSAASGRYGYQTQSPEWGRDVDNGTDHDDTIINTLMKAVPGAWYF